MPEQPYRLFISYSHEDKAQRTRLRKHLASLEAEGLVTVWDDCCIRPGDLWREKLEEALKNSEVALLLVSANFIASPFCQKVEVPDILEGHREDGVLIIPVIVDNCVWENITLLSQFQALPGGGKAVPKYRPQSEGWTEITESIRRRLKEEPPVRKPRAAAPAARAAKESSMFSLTNLLQDLPRQPAELFGRDESLRWLDDAYATPSPGVRALIGFGGVGKSSLVRHWLKTRFEPDATTPRFLGVSFYSQGTREQAGSSDQFLVQALEMFEGKSTGRKSAWERGERLAELVAAEPTVLVLDGLEPLQYGPGPHNLEGRLKDPGIHALLARLAARPGRCFCLVSSRLELKDEDLRTPSCAQRSLGVLGIADASALLSSRGVKGGAEELKRAAEYLGRHPLALVLAAEYLHTFAGSDVARVYEIDLLSEETKEGRHAKSVMAAYETALRRDGLPLDLELLCLLGLFDRPMRWEWLKVLAAPEAIAGVTEQLTRATDRDIRESLSRLHQWDLISDPGISPTPVIDAHPLVREYFGERLRRASEAGWRAAHGRMFDHLTFFDDLTPGRKEFPNTLDEMEPLYQSIPHGCAAGRHLEAFAQVYYRRIHRRREFFSLRKLGAASDDLAALSCFFEPPFKRPVGLTGRWRALLLGQTGHRLRILVRFREAIPLMLEALEADKSRADSKRAEGQDASGDLKNASIDASTLGAIHLTLGELPRALFHSEEGVKLAEQSGDDGQWKSALETLGDVLHQAGRLPEAESKFLRAQEIIGVGAKDFSPAPALGYRYRNLLLSQGKYVEVQRIVEQILEARTETTGTLTETALNHLSLGQAHLLQARGGDARHLGLAEFHLKQALEYLRQAARQDHFPRGLLALAKFHLFVGETGRARAALDEAFSIAQRDMGLHQADCHLEYARLHLTLNEKDAARGHLITAKSKIEKMGYHRRDGDVREIEEQLRENMDG